MRIRTIKPEFWQNEELAEMSAESALLAIGLLNYADDEGFFKLHPKLIESTIFPLRELSMTIHGMLSELSRVGFISTHEGSDGKKYGQIVNFLKHQRVNRPNASKIAPILLSVSSRESSVIPHQQFSEPSLPEGKGIGREQGTGKGVSSPPPAEVIDFIWKSVPQISRTRSSQVKLESEWKRIKAGDRPSLDEIETALDAWNNCSKWQEGFSEGVHLWVKNKQWNNLPTALPDKKPEANLGNRTASIAKLENKTNKSEEEES